MAIKIQKYIKNKIKNSTYAKKNKLTKQLQKKDISDWIDTFGKIYSIFVN